MNGYFRFPAVVWQSRVATEFSPNENRKRVCSRRVNFAEKKNKEQFDCAT